MYRSQHERFTVFSFSKTINNSKHAIYGNTFKAGSQTSVNKHNSTCGMCFILFLLSFSMKKPTMMLN